MFDTTFLRHSVNARIRGWSALDYKAILLVCVFASGIDGSNAKAICFLVCGPAGR